LVGIASITTFKRNMVKTRSLFNKMHFAKDFVMRMMTPWCEWRLLCE